jgi:hypothetical protein
VVSALDLSTSAQTKDQAWTEGELIPEAQAAIDAYLGFSFQTDGSQASPATRLYGGRDETRLYMIDRLVFLSQVLETQYLISQSSSGFTYVQTSQVDITADCALKPDNTIPALYLKRKSGLPFSEGEQNYTVKGVFGRPFVPGDISRACVRVVVSWYKMRDTNYSDFLIEGMVRQHYERVLPSDVKELLDKYKPRIFRA